MATVIKSNVHPGQQSGVAFNFEDMAAQATAQLERVRTDAAQIVTQAENDARALRHQAEKNAYQAALKDLEAITEAKVRDQMATVLPALREAIKQLHDAKHVWLTQWEANAVHLAGEIARRIIRRELKNDPNITLTWVREALQLAAGSARVRLLLNPADTIALQKEIKTLTNELSRLAPAEVIADPSIEPGGCKVETEFGTIDQQISTQIDRIEEELTCRS